MPSFQSDLAQEQVLSEFLDEIYAGLDFDFSRKQDSASQHAGIDLTIHHNGDEYRIDEKAQLHYLNKDLPTFTFELSYKLRGEMKQGWLFDLNKVTSHYFLITGIRTSKDCSTLEEMDDIESLKITSVNRVKLLQLLAMRGLTEESLNLFDQSIREEYHYGKNTIDRLDSKSEGLLYFTQHLDEEPMNLQLRLEFLIREGVAKRIYPTTE